MVLGQGKSGTSLIYRELQSLGTIGLTQPKELHYFSAKYAKGFDWYQSHFDHIGPEAQRIGEISPSYMRVDPVTRIAETLGTDLKVVFVLRHPVDHAYSRYLQNICASRTGEPFHLSAQWLEARLLRLFKAIALCYELFGQDNVLPLFFERDVQGNDRGFLGKILKFLDMDLPDHLDEMPPTVNSGVMPRFLVTGDSPLEMTLRGVTYRIPADRLVFCGQARNSTVRRNPSDADLRAAMVQQSQWSTEVSIEEYTRLHRKFVKPFARRLTKNFGYDMTLWEGMEKRLAYPLAAPPPQFELDHPI